jgi:hypothetical protein
MYKLNSSIQEARAREKVRPWGRGTGWLRCSTFMFKSLPSDDMWQVQVLLREF